MDIEIPRSALDLDTEEEINFNFINKDVLKKLIELNKTDFMYFNDKEMVS